MKTVSYIELFFIILYLSELAEFMGEAIVCSQLNDVEWKSFKKGLTNVKGLLKTIGKFSLKGIKYPLRYCMKNQSIITYMYCTSPIILYLAVPAIASLLGK
jgi:hypothetical protein